MVETMFTNKAMSQAEPYYLAVTPSSPYSRYAMPRKAAQIKLKRGPETATNPLAVFPFRGFITEYEGSRTLRKSH